VQGLGCLLSAAPLPGSAVMLPPGAHRPAPSQHAGALAAASGSLFVSPPEALPYALLAHERGAAPALLCSSVARWGPGQLRQEIAEGCWVVAASSDLSALLRASVATSSGGVSSAGAASAAPGAAAGPAPKSWASLPLWDRLLRQLGPAYAPLLQVPARLALARVTTGTSPAAAAASWSTAAVSPSPVASGAAPPSGSSAGDRYAAALEEIVRLWRAAGVRPPPPASSVTGAGSGRGAGWPPAAPGAGGRQLR
jgi:hypothetical protein